MRKLSEQFCRKSDTYFCVDKSATAVVIKGLAEHRETLGAPLCPCRKECHCLLFLTPDNDFAGKDQTITLDEIRELTANM
uniref:Ferredoxin-thioredoxin reductase catalytic chain, chloroplastic n=1 Tax=Chenopodium quinoa TaxID=63459 RepID=A0A803MBZ7_CHEQI